MLSLLIGDHRQLANLMFQKRIINYNLFLKQQSTDTILVPAETLSLPPMLGLLSRSGYQPCPAETILVEKTSNYQT